MEKKAAKDIKKGEFVRRKATSKKTYTRGTYCRYERKYELHDEDDISRSIYIKGTTKLYIDFDY